MLSSNTVTENGKLLLSSPATHPHTTQHNTNADKITYPNKRQRRINPHTKKHPFEIPSTNFIHDKLRRFKCGVSLSLSLSFSHWISPWLIGITLWQLRDISIIYIRELRALCIDVVTIVYDSFHASRRSGRSGASRHARTDAQIASRRSGLNSLFGILGLQCSEIDGIHTQCRCSKSQES